MEVTIPKDEEIKIKFKTNSGCIGYNFKDHRELMTILSRAMERKTKIKQIK